MSCTDAFVRRVGPALKIGATRLAPTFASANLSQAADATAVLRVQPILYVITSRRCPFGGEADSLTDAKAARGASVLESPQTPAPFPANQISKRFRRSVWLQQSLQSLCVWVHISIATQGCMYSAQAAFRVVDATWDALRYHVSIQIKCLMRSKLCGANCNRRYSRKLLKHITQHLGVKHK